MKALLWIRFRYLLDGYSKMFVSGKGGLRSGRKSSPVSVVLLSLLFLYGIGVLLAGVTWFFWQMTAFADLGLSWLYFSLALLAGGALAVLGSVYSTQSQLYNARDNELLLAMPIRMEQLCLSRVLFLLLGTFGWIGFLAIPAFVVYWIRCGMTAGIFFCFLLMLLAVTFLCQTITCLLGWLLHLLLARIRNKAIGSLLFMVLFLGIYFPVYFGVMGQFEDILGSLSLIGGELAVLFDGIGGPLVWLGQGVMGEVLPLLAMLVLSALVTAVGYFFLIATYRRSLLRPVRSAAGAGSRRMAGDKAASPVMAICRKELRRFLTCSVYLTNSGIGLLMLLFCGIAGGIFRGRVLEAFASIPDGYRPLFMTGALVLLLSFLLSTVWLTAPSVSLEGRSFWLPASLPLSGRVLLRGKLLFHVLASVPLSAAVALFLGLLYGLPLPTVGLVTLFSAASALLSGLVGLLWNLRFPRFDWLHEGYPCKQSAAVFFTMLTLMGVSILAGGGFVLVCWLTADLGAAASTLGAASSLLLVGLLTGICWFLLDKWGVRRMEELLRNV